MLLVTVLVVSVLALIGKNYVVNTYRDWKYAPIVNPHPKYFMTVKGKIDPRLIGKITLGIQGMYVTNNKVCDNTYNLFGKYIDHRYKMVTFYPTTDPRSSDYEIKAPLDYFEPDFCKWSILTLGDYSGNFSWLTLTVAGFAPCDDSLGCKENSSKQSDFKKIGEFSNFCEKDEVNKYSCKPGKDINFNDYSLLQKDSNYTLIENYNLINGDKNVKHS